MEGEEGAEGRRIRKSNKKCEYNQSILHACMYVI
jgi:hypothetical protein